MILRYGYHLVDDVALVYQGDIKWRIMIVRFGKKKIEISSWIYKLLLFLTQAKISKSQKV